jgi:hypothetical protein
MKYCKKCDSQKDFCFFGKNKNNKDGLSIYCKECEKNRHKEYRENNRSKVNESSKKWRKNNPEKYKITIENYLEKNPHMTSKERVKEYRKNDEFVEKQRKYRKEYYEKNIEIEREKRKKYYNENKEIERKNHNEWKKNRLKNDGFFRMKTRLRDRIRDYMYGKVISKRTKNIVGLEYDEFKNYISSMFEVGMTWDNYGSWHLDHIIPLCSAKNEDEIYKLNHYTNLQPLWAEDNIRKNRKY